MTRYTVPQAEGIIDEEQKILDFGSVALIDYMGSDRAIADAARCSFGKEAYKNEKDNYKLINRLMKDGHTSCFEMVELKFRIKLPIFVMRQLIRHRTAHVNEFSARYAELADEFYIPKLGNIKPQSETNKQGTSSVLEYSVEKQLNIQLSMIEANTQAFSEYKLLLKDKLARETARIIVPPNVYTLCIWKIDLHNFFNFLRLRLDPHAQWEIRQYANAMYTMAWHVAPVACNAFIDHVMYAHTYSRLEHEELLENIKDKDEKILDLEEKLEDIRTQQLEDRYRERE